MPVPSHCCARVRAQPNEPAVQWFPATHVSKLLIDFIDTNVGAFRRNTQASYCLLERARNIARKINSLIEFVEVNDAWDMYDKYTSSIEPLEDCLISSLDTVEKERNQYLITEQLESIDTCITFIEAWATQRADIRAKLELLRMNSEFTTLFDDSHTAANEHIKGAYHHDDITFLEKLVEALALAAGRAGSCFRHPTARILVTDVMNKIKDVQSRLATPHNEMEDSSIVLSIKTVMVIYSTMELIKARKPNALWLECAKSEVIWEAAQILLIQLIAHLENGTPQLVDVQNKYNELLSRLQRGSMTGDIRLPPNFPQLMKHTGRIGRSYHAQALYTVALCRELADHFEGATNKTVQDFELLRLTIDKTLRALKAARLEDGATLTMFDLEAFDTSEISRAFVSARIEIKRCFDKFGMGITWNTRSRSLKESIERDKNRMKQINDLLARAVEVAPPVSVEVKIYKTERKEIHTTNYTDLPPDTRLCYIQRLAGNERYLDNTIGRSVLAHSHFEQAGRRLGMDVDVKSLVPVGAKRTLALIID